MMLSMSKSKPKKKGVKKIFIDKGSQNRIAKSNDQNATVQMNVELQSDSLIQNFQQKWQNSQNFNHEVVSLEVYPFKHVLINRLVKDEKFLDNLCNELSAISYERMLNDLYSFHQTDSLLEQKDRNPAIRAMLDLISGPLKYWLQNVTCKNFTEKLTVTASQYKFTDYLLCHDDNLEDRSVAFIFYICKNWKDEDGGSLDLFQCDSENQPREIVKSILPGHGSFICFEVTHNSYHQVAEVLSREKVRLSINGWFHGAPLKAQTIWKESLPKMHYPLHYPGSPLIYWLNKQWRDIKTQRMVGATFAKELSVSLPNIFTKKIYGAMQKSLKDSGIIWTRAGPANRKRYYVAKVISLPSIVRKFLTLIRSTNWFKFLSNCTVEMDPTLKLKPKCCYEVQHWQPGDYTLLVDDDPTAKTGIDVHIYFMVKNGRTEAGGAVHYFGPDRNEDGFLEDAAQLEPCGNMLTFVARIDGMARVTKYLNHSNSEFYKIIATYSQGT